MVTLPPPFTATKYPGYFWNTETKRLCTLKVHGVLKELAFCRPNKWNDYKAGYRVSVQGRNRFLPLIYLMTLKCADSEIPVTMPAREEVTA